MSYEKASAVFRGRVPKELGSVELLQGEFGLQRVGFSEQSCRNHKPAWGRDLAPVITGGGMNRSKGGKKRRKYFNCIRTTTWETRVSLLSRQDAAAHVCFASMKLFRYRLQIVWKQNKTQTNNKQTNKAAFIQDQNSCGLPQPDQALHCVLQLIQQKQCCASVPYLSEICSPKLIWLQSVRKGESGAALRLFCCVRYTTNSLHYEIRTKRRIAILPRSDGFSLVTSHFPTRQPCSVLPAYDTEHI